MARTEALPLRIHVLRRLNPVITCVLTSPLHGIASKRLLVLAYRGRKSGTTYHIPLAYVISAGTVYCVTRETLWWKSAVAADTVTLWLRGQPLRMRAEKAAVGAAETRAAFVKFLRHNPGTAKLLYDVPMDGRGEPDAAAVDEQGLRSNVIRFVPVEAAE